jgi:hypothetical protein
MSLTTLVKKDEINAAYNALVKNLKAGATKYRRVVGWKGGNDEFTLYWHPEWKFWVLFAVGDDGGYWCPYGVVDPSNCKTVSITCEINPPVQGINRRKGGVFLRDAGGNLYLAHTGKVAGGRQGVGKAAFLDSLGGGLTKVEWSDGVTTKVVVLGRIGRPSLLRNLSSYLHAIASFKENATGAVPAAILTKNPGLSFSPEFSGPRKKYELTDAIESQCDHGTVVNTLHDELEALGLEAYKTGKIDLFLADHDANISHLMEVKTDQCTTSIYQAVGQVMLHSALEKNEPHRILVLPGKVSTDTAARLKRLGIRVLSYGWKDEKPIFEDLKDILKT